MARYVFARAIAYVNSMCAHIVRARAYAYSKFRLTPPIVDHLPTPLHTMAILYRCIAAGFAPIQ